MPKPLPPEQRIEWNEIIRQQKESGLSIEKWCHQNQIRPHAFYYWRDKLFPKSLNRTNFTELPEKKGYALTIECQGIRIHLEKGCNPIFRKQLFSLLLEQPC